MRKLTVNEYAKELGVSKASIYKRIAHNRLKTTKETADNREITYILLDDKDIQPNSTDSNPNSTPFQPDFQPLSTPSSTPFQPDIQPQADFIDFLKSQIEEKDRLIDELRKTKDREIAELHTLLFNQQELHAKDKALLTAYQEKERKSEEQAQEVIAPEPQAAQEPKKRNWLYRLFFYD